MTPDTAACVRCGHARSDHSGAREDDFTCRMCDCAGFDAEAWPDRTPEEAVTAVKAVRADEPQVSAARCAAFAIEDGVVIDCVLTHGHDGSHDPGDMTGVRAMSAASNDVQMEPVEAVTAALRAHIDRTRLPITEDYADIAAHVALGAAADWLAERAANPVEPDEWGIHSSGMRHAANLLDGGDRDENA